MILRILRDKFLRLGRDDDGVAMVVTLAIFMLMWLVCAGVYAIGTAAKTRIHLQNACDAAAYSAAVVQADTLSRIATINRAMAWTYIAMSRRQMDYIVDRWLDRTVQKVKVDVATAKATGSPGLHMHNYWTLRPSVSLSPRCGIFDDEDHESVSVSLNGTSTPRVGSRSRWGSIKYEISNFEQTWFFDSSFYRGVGSGIDVMRRQIDADKNTLREMYEAEKNLSGDLPGRVSDAVEDVLLANAIPDIEWHHKVFQSKGPYEGATDAYLKILDSSEERRYLLFANYHPSDASKPFDQGSANSQWFPQTGSAGFCRKYSQSSALQSSWTWRSWRWICTDKGCYKVPAGFGSGLCLGIECHDSYFDGVPAKPLVLKQDYFDKEGTITVGIAVENKNPWTPILGTAIKGIFSAFNIGGDVMPLYTVCFASAKAGYKEAMNWGNTRGVETEDRAYHVDWQNEEDWNLRQSDWDAVLIPVRMSQTLASGGSWGAGNLNFLDGYANDLGVNDYDMKAGGNGLDISEHYGNRDLGEEYRFGNQDGFWGGAAQATSQDGSGSVKAKWQIGNPNGRIDWDGLQKVMFH